jgi:alpha-D-ribose 1-methylphosphonate 5-triphosphate synthase subunit PhnG
MLQVGADAASTVIDALEAAHQARCRATAGAVAPTRVDFFTMVRE